VSDQQAELDRHFAWLENKLPPKPARFLAWLRRPSSRLVRLPLGFLLILGGILSFLPVLGIWMLPLGLMLIAQDIPILQGPSCACSLGWSASGRTTSAPAAARPIDAGERPRCCSAWCDSKGPLGDQISYGRSIASQFPL